MKKLYNVFADGSFMGYAWALTSADAIAVIKGGETDNMVWTTELSGAAVVGNN